jgi:UDP-N-acetylglucosamine 2-epimerase
MKRFLVVIGTRPSAVKLAPVVHALESRGAVADVCLTGQQSEMLDCCLESLLLVPTHRFLGFNGAPLAYRLGDMVRRLSEILEGYSYDGVVVVGDTVSGMAGALAGAFSDIPVAHVEAGLRTREREPWPEEMTRRAIDSIATWHFAPTAIAEDNLLAERIDPGGTWFVGNTVVDSLRDLGIHRHRSALETILVTIHRRENWDHLPVIAAFISELAARFPFQFAWPVHPNPTIAEAVQEACRFNSNVTLSPPLPYDRFMTQLAAAHLVITDSGGIQEEAAVLGVPTLVIRKNTERPEALMAGVSRLVGPVEFFKVAQALLKDAKQLTAMECTTTEFGDGHAGERIADILLTGETPLGELS